MWANIHLLIVLVVSMCLFCGQLQRKNYRLSYILAENYSIYGVEIVLTRVLSPYILSVYLPSAMFVSMSWVTFNIHVYAQGE